MVYYHFNDKIFMKKKCSCCKINKILNIQNFSKIKNKKGVYIWNYKCRECVRKYYKDYYQPHKEDIKRKQSIKQKKFSIRIKLSKYKRFDKLRKYKFDLTLNWLKENIENKPCTYCNDINNTGCDRINNSKGHTKDNVVPCCRDCNTTRNDIYTFEEMLLIGKVIKQIKEARGQTNMVGVPTQIIQHPPETIL